MDKFTIVCAVVALFGSVKIALDRRVHEGWVVDVGIALCAIGTFGIVARGIAQRDSYLADQFSAALIFAGLDLVVLGIFLNTRKRRRHDNAGHRGRGKHLHRRAAAGGGDGA